MEFTFIMIDNEHSTKIEHTIDAVHLDEVLEQMDAFIKGSGYHPVGELGYREDD